MTWKLYCDLWFVAHILLWLFIILLNYPLNNHTHKHMEECVCTTSEIKYIATFTELSTYSYLVYLFSLVFILLTESKKNPLYSPFPSLNTCIPSSRSPPAPSYICHTTVSQVTKTFVREHLLYKTASEWNNMLVSGFWIHLI